MDRRLFALAAIALCSQGCSDLRRSLLGTKAAHQAIAKTDAAPRFVPRDNTSPVESGPGLIVFNPVPPKGASEDLKRFARSCGYYINFYATGQPELGKSPYQDRWLPVSYGFKADINFTESDAPAATAMFGVTHVGIGVLEGSGDQYTLTYRLLAEPGNTKIGTALTITGSLQQITDGLPRIIREFDTRLGVKEPKIPAKMNLTADDLVLFGSSYQESLTPKMEALALKDAAVAFSNLSTGFYASPTVRREAIEAALQAYPENPVAWGYLAQIDPSLFGDHGERLTALQAKYPHNSALAIAMQYFHRHQGHYREATEFARTAVANSPGYHANHVILCAVLLGLSDSIRNGKIAGDITSGEESEIFPMYEEAVKEGVKASERNPMAPDGWYYLAEAAMFAGDSSLSVKALDRAGALYHGLGPIAWLGLEMHDPKWGGSTEDERAFGEKLANDESIKWDEAFSVATLLDQHDMPELGKKLRAREVSRQEKGVAAAPKDPVLSSYLSNAYLSVGKTEEAFGAAQKAANLAPLNVAFLGRAAELAYRASHMEVALQYSDACLKLDPNNEDALGIRAYVMVSQGKSHEAEKAALAALKINPKQEMAQFALSGIYSKKGDWAGAFAVWASPKEMKDEKFWQRFIDKARDKNAASYLFLASLGRHVYPESVERWIQCADANHASGNYKEQIKVAQEGLKRFPGEMGFLDNIAEGYEYLGDRTNAIKYYRQVLEVFKHRRPDQTSAYNWRGQAIERLLKLKAMP